MEGTFTSRADDFLVWVNTPKDSMQRQSKCLRLEGTAFAFPGISVLGPALRPPSGGGRLLPPSHEARMDLQDKSEPSSSESSTI